MQAANSMAAFTLEDEQIIWTDNHLAFVRLIWIYVVLSSTCSSRQTNRLGKIVFPDGQISDDLFVEKFVRPIFTWDNLFIWDDLAVQTICSSSSVKTANKSKVFNLDGSVRFRKPTLIELSNSQQHRDAISAEHLQRVSAFHREINEKENTAHDVSFKAFYSLYWLAKEEIPNRKFTSLLSLLEHLGLEEMKY